MATVLKKGEFQGKGNGEVRVEFAENDFCLNFFNDNIRREQASQCLKEYFGEPLRVVCLERKLTAEKASEQAAPIGKADLRKKIIEHPMLQK